MSEKKGRIQRVWFNLWRRITKRRKKSKKSQNPPQDNANGESSDRKLPDMRCGPGGPILRNEIPAIVLDSDQSNAPKKDVRHSSSLAKANSELALKLANALSKDHNVFISPFTVSVCMSMLLMGARDESAAELRRALGYDSEDFPAGEIHDSFRELIKVLDEARESYTLNTANAITYSKNFQLRSEYKSDLQEKYFAEAFEVDFSENTEQAVVQINEWVKRKTSDMIDGIFDELSPLTVVVLSSAVYFKGNWEKRFNPDLTRPQTFYNKGLKEQKKQVPMMLASGYFRYWKGDLYKALELPYKGNELAMLVLLPDDTDGLDNVVKSLEGDFLQQVLQKRKGDEDIDLCLPKFRLESSADLKGAFENLGVETIFAGTGNLEGISESEELRVTEIAHKAVIEVNEEGSTAASVTAVDIEKCADFDKPEFRADHPFLFVVYDKRYDLVLFIGRVEEL